MVRERRNLQGLGKLERLKHSEKRAETGMEPASNLTITKPLSLVRGTGEDHGVRSEAWLPAVSPHPWDGYLGGPENELAMAAVQALALGERDGVSPLVVYGPSGVGKSRLLAGLVAECLRRRPDITVAYLDAQSFVIACMEAVSIAGGLGWSELRSRFRSVSLFVLEDIEGLERSPLARDELVHTLDALDVTGATLAFSARSAPGTWLYCTWPKRLVNRLMGGLAISIAAPGLASRRRYILQNASEHGVALQAEAVETIAEAADSYRTIEGWLSRLALEARLGHQQTNRRIGPPLTSVQQRSPAHSRSVPFDSCQVATILADDKHLVEPIVAIDTIAREVAGRFGIRLSLLRGPSRRALVVLARHLAMYLARTFTGSSLVTIGLYFGGRAPASVRHGCKVTTLRLKNDPALTAVVATFESRSPRVSTDGPREFG
jgi:chromosomal replication initiator protein